MPKTIAYCFENLNGTSNPHRLYFTYGESYTVIEKNDEEIILFDNYSSPHTVYMSKDADNWDKYFVFIDVDQ